MCAVWLCSAVLQAPTVLALGSPRTIKASCPAEHCKWRPTADGKSFEPSEALYRDLHHSATRPVRMRPSFSLNEKPGRI
ncbi:hypothetical protein TNCT_475311 [Trichonephila clavata]|uniref:Secreted protein n=1 Tax=Trichonephila clavata TaxID=2740835 RepID=A0A8X6IHV0_TRICU|nr:hypothetical protein TNCT_475311 [Trichonephila clavata]